MHKRRAIATLTVLLALAGRGLPQTPEQLPEPLGDAMPAPSRIVISAPEQPKPAEGQKPEELRAAKPAPKPVAAPKQPAASCPCNGAQEKPSLEVTHTGPPDQMWFSAGYLLWKLADRPLPSTLVAVNGAPVVGGPAGSTDFGNFSGIHIDGGVWLDCQHVFGVNYAGFLLEQKHLTTTVTSSGAPGAPVITRPVIDALTTQPVIILVGGPGLAGSFTVDSSIQLGSAEFNFTRNLWYNEFSSFEALMGFRYIGLEEDLTMTQVSQQTAGTGTLPFNGATGATGFNRVTITDVFHTRNQLWAGQLGAHYEACKGIWFGSITSKVAMGPNMQTFIVQGSSVATGPTGGTATAPSGILALSGANATSANTRWFTIAPEVGVQAGMQVSQYMRVFVGYDFLYINNVVRPGDLVNTTINQRFVPTSAAFGTTSGPQEPLLRTSRDDFFAHGVEFGMQFMY
ncbi:MAG: BBP7 family outer membrane beta-barrel protein [Gemmataceae bacterium]